MVLSKPGSGDRVGLDVGGTRVDAGIIHAGAMLSGVKAPTTEDVTSGVASALNGLLGGA